METGKLRGGAIGRQDANALDAFKMENVAIKDDAGRTDAPGAKHPAHTKATGLNRRCDGVEE